MSVALPQTVSTALFEVSGDLAMSLDDEYQYALTAADQLGPLPPLALRAQWLASGAVSGQFPWKLLGTFRSPGPFQGDFALALQQAAAPGVGWGSDGGNPYGFRTNAVWLLFLVDPAVTGTPPRGPWPFAGVAGVIRPSNYDIATPVAALRFNAQGNDPANGIWRSIHGDNANYVMGYSNDAINGWSSTSPTPPWSTSDGPGGPSLGGSIEPVGGLSPSDAIWQLTAGRTYAVMAIPFGPPNGPGGAWPGPHPVCFAGPAGAAVPLGATAPAGRRRRRRYAQEYAAFSALQTAQRHRP